MVTDFRIKEIMETKVDEKCDEWRSMVDQMGLEGQISMTEKNGEPIPYQRIDKEFGNVFKLLFNRESELREYKHDIIPMEALGLIYWAEQTKMFEKIIVKYHDANPDPVAVGIIGKDKYLIAGWGADKMTRESFIERFRKEANKFLRQKLPSAIANLKREIAELESKSGFDGWEEEAIEHYLEYGWWPGNF